MPNCRKIWKIFEASSSVDWVPNRVTSSSHSRAAVLRLPIMPQKLKGSISLMNDEKRSPVKWEEVYVIYSDSFSSETCVCVFKNPVAKLHSLRPTPRNSVLLSLLSLSLLYGG